jgi:hypothetical protein|tara:strand:- start:513 stop:1172 length:660 start_codon:yes stop_codon:yes gene_type:complete
MAKDKKAFVAYCDWLESFEELTDEEAGKLIKHLLRYVNDQNPEPPDRITQMCFIPIKQSLKRDLRKYEERAERSRLNGAKGGRPKTQKTQQVISEPKKPDRDTDSDSVTDTDRVIKIIEQHSLLDDSLAQVFEEFIQHRKQLKKPMTKIAISRMVAKLNKYDARTAEQMLVQSMENGWVGIFDLKKEDNGKQTRADQALANIASGSNEALNQVKGLGSF